MPPCKALNPINLAPDKKFVRRFCLKIKIFWCTKKSARQVPDQKAKLGIRFEEKYDAWLFQPRRKMKRCTLKRFALGDAKPIEAAIDTWRKQLEKVEDCYGRTGKMIMCLGQAKTMDQAGTKLRDLIWEPFAKKLSSPDIYVVPGGRITEVSLESLPNTKGDYLLETHKLTLLPYPSIVTHMYDRVSAATENLVVGDLDYDRSSTIANAQKSWKACTSAGCSGQAPTSSKAGSIAQSRGGQACGYNIKWPNLGVTEASDVAKQLGLHRKTILVRGDSGIESELRKTFHNKKIIHFATHGFFADKKKCRDFANAGQTPLGFILALQKHQILWA